jgi:hypothetical protein
MSWASGLRKKCPFQISKSDLLEVPYKVYALMQDISGLKF